MCSQKKFNLFLLTIGLLSVSVANLFGGINVVDPNGLKANINTLGYIFQDQIGNYTVGQFNADASKLVFPFDNQFGYGALVPPAQLDAIVLTKAVSGIDFTVTFHVPTPGTGYGRLRTSDKNSDQTFRATSTTTSDAYALVYKYAAETASISLSKLVNGVAFTISRLAVNANIVLLDSDGQEIVSYVMPANSTGSGKPRSFFGYYNSQETKIAKIVINTPGLYATGNQFYLDDLSVILPICSDNPMIGDLNNDCYVNVADLNFLVLNWLTYNDPN